MGSIRKSGKKSHIQRVSIGFLTLNVAVGMKMPISIESTGGTPTAWYRYLQLGYFAFEDCSEFEEVWANLETDPLLLHQVIWYQFMYHMDRNIEISEKLQAWATEVSHAYLSYNDPSTFVINTKIYI